MFALQVRNSLRNGSLAVANVMSLVNDNSLPIVRKQILKTIVWISVLRIMLV